MYTVIVADGGEEVRLKFAPGSGVRLVDVETDYVEMTAAAARATLRHLLSRIAAARAVATDDPDEPRNPNVAKRLDRAAARLDQRKFAAETLEDFLYARTADLDDHETQVVVGVAKSAEREIAFIVRYTANHRRDADARFVAELAS